MPWPPHITVATIVQRNDQYLMVEEFVNGRLVLNQPAGHLEEGESLFEAALRETLEETGWSVELNSVCGIYQYESAEILFHRIAFAASPLEQLTTALDPDIHAAHWMSIDEIRQHSLRSPMVEQCILDAGKTQVPLDVIKHF